MIKALIPSLKRCVNCAKLYLKQWSKPGTASIAVGTLIDLRRNRRELIVENAMLRQQLIVLHRQVKRPHLTQGDRLLMILLARMTGTWQQALHIVVPGSKRCILYSRNAIALASGPVPFLLAVQIED